MHSRLLWNCSIAIYRAKTPHGEWRGVCPFVTLAVEGVVEKTRDFVLFVRRWAGICFKKGRAEFHNPVCLRVPAEEAFKAEAPMP